MNASIRLKNVTVFVFTTLVILTDANARSEQAGLGIKTKMDEGSAKRALRPKKVLFVIVDGIPADVIEKVETPGLDTIAKYGHNLSATVGGKKDSYSETPTISAVGYNSLLTGTWVNKHNVWDNDIANPNYHYPTIFRLLKDQYPQKKTGIFSTWEDNRTKLVGEGLHMTGGLKVDFVFDGLEKDTITYPHDAEKKYIHLIDEEVVRTAAETIVKHGPDLSWVYLEYTDDMGHKFGDGPQFYNAVEIMDKQVAKLWASVKARSEANNEDWQIYITTDHGRDSINGKGHGGQSERERSTWIVTNAPDVNAYFVKHRPVIVDIMPSIARFMNISIPRAHLMEIDGTSLTGRLSGVNASAVSDKSKIMVRWQVLDTSGTAKIWLATDNKHRLGIPDKYVLVATVPVAAEQASIDITRFKSRFYKVVIEMKENMLNCWAGDDLKAQVQKYK